jgi:hypothetical protein
VAVDPRGADLKRYLEHVEHVRRTAAPHGEWSIA